MLICHEKYNVKSNENNNNNNIIVIMQIFFLLIFGVKYDWDFFLSAFMKSTQKCEFLLKDSICH